MFFFIYPKCFLCTRVKSEFGNSVDSDSAACCSNNSLNKNTDLNHESIPSESLHPVDAYGCYEGML